MNFGKTTGSLVDDHVLGLVLPHLLVIMPTKIPVAAVLDVKDHRKRNDNSIEAERNSDPDFES